MSYSINLLGIKVSAVTKAEIVERISEFALSGKGRFITYLNAHCVNISFRDDGYRKILQKADMVYTGGQGVVWAARFLGTPLPERVTILDFLDMLIKRLIDKGITVYLLGSEADIVKKAAQALKNKGLEIVGSRDGFFDKAEEGKIMHEINILKPHILIVGMGVPKQEEWIFSHLRDLDVNLCWAVGAAFDWISGYRKRAPRWMIKSGFEWLHRLSQQPKRLLQRYLIGNLVFIFRVLEWRIKRSFISSETVRGGSFF